MIYTHVPDISCFYSDVIDDELFLPTAHFEYEMILITGGKSQAVVNHKTYMLTEKSLIFISRLERHNFIIEAEPYCRYVVTLSSDLVLSYTKDAELISIFIQRPREFCHVMTLSDETYQSVLPLFAQMAGEYTRKLMFYETRSAAGFISILIELYRSNPEYFPMRGHSTMSDAVLNAQRYVNEHFNRKLTLTEIADQNFISRHALSLAFKDIVGTTFKEYLLLFRITEAKKLLITTDFSVSQIAEAVGYVNVNNFVKIFKDREGTTPLQYRKQFVDSRL